MSTPTILLVEDNPDDDLLLRDLFARLPDAYVVTTLKDTLAATEYISGEGRFSDREAHPIPSLVLLDVNLPGGSGLDVLGWIRRDVRCCDLPVVMISGSKSAADIHRAYELGANFYLIKPMSLTGLQEAVSLVSVSKESSFHVLLIDDSSDDRALAMDELHRVFPAIRITEAEGKVGITIAIERDDYDLVITDYQMHAIDGLTVLRTVKARRPDCPVIILTGTGSEETAVEAMRSGLDDYLLKSSKHRARLPVAVRSVMARAGQRSALLESEERFRATFEQAAVGMAHVGPDGHYLRVNQRLCEIVGYSREELRNLSFQKITHPDDLGRDLEHYRRMLSGEMVTYATEKRYRRRDGSYVWVHLTTSLVRDVSGAPKYFISVVQDISDRKQAEEALRLSEEQLRQSQKLEAIGRLAGGVAHDFNNLLTAILGYSHLLASQLGEAHPLAADVREIQKAGDRAAALTRQLLVFSRKQVLVPEVLDLNGVVRNLDKMLRRIIGEDIELTLTLDPQLGRVKADPGQIEQVIMNVVVNSRDAMPSGGRLEIETTNITIRGSDGHAEIRPGPYVLMVISDTGVGMDPKTQSHIFEPFFTTKEKGKGTGLGLSMVYGIVKQSDGYIEMGSEPGKGTTFAIYLPLVGAEVAARIDPVPRGAGIAPGSETVLVVEDDPAVRTLACAVLRRHGYTVLQASSPAEAREVAASHCADLDLVLTDVVMPGMSGPELATLIKSSCPTVNVLYISGYSDEGTSHMLNVTGAAFLQKPFTPESLARKLREVLEADG